VASSVYDISKGIDKAIAHPSFLHVASVIFVSQSTLALHGTNTHISMAKILLLILSSLALAALVTDHSLDASSFGSDVGAGVGRLLSAFGAVLFKHSQRLEDALLSLVLWLQKVCVAASSAPLA